MIEIGTYHPNEAGANTLREARPLHVDGKRVSVVVEPGEVSLFVGGSIIVTASPLDFESVSALHTWARMQATSPKTSPERGEDGWSIDGPETNPGGFHIVRRPDGSKYGQTQTLAAARIMLSQGCSKGIGHAWRADTLFGPKRRRSAVLKTTERLAIQGRLSAGESIASLAREYDVSEATIARYRVDDNYRP